MDRFAEWVARHPGVVAFAIAALGAGFTFNAYRTGVAYAQLRAEVGERARVASEALGG